MPLLKSHHSGSPPVIITIASVAVRARSERFDPVAAEYLQRAKIYCETEARVFKTATALFEWVERLRGRTSPMLVMLDERGKQFSSQALAQWLSGQRDEGRQHIIFALGPADGWSGADRARAGLLLSLGSMTLPHELARVVISEQVYRAFTILAGHPYHRSGE